MLWGCLLATLLCAPAAHVQVIDQPVLDAEDGPLLGNGDLSVSVYQTRDKLVYRLGKGDVWDRRLDTADDPKPPHISEIARGIRDEGWKCSPYGDGVPVALRGTKDPQRMKEICSGAPASYTKRPYPCPKPTGEVSLQLPPDLPGLTVRHELAFEEGILRTTCTWPLGFVVRIEAYIPPSPNVLVLRWSVEGWSETTRMGHLYPPVWPAVYRWRDPTTREYGQRFAADSRHGEFLVFDHAKCTPLPPPTVKRIADRPVIEQTFHGEPTFTQGFRYLLAPFCSAGWQPQPVDLGASGEARLRCDAAKETTSGWLAVAVPTESDAGGAEAELARLTPKLTAEATLDEYRAATRAAAAEFWARSSVTIDDPLLQSLWYDTLHARRCTNAPGKLPPGLFLPSTVQDYSHWHGDWHTNYNYQQPFYADYTANQVAMGDAFFTGMDYMLQAGRLIASRYYGTRGAFIQLTNYPIKAIDDPLGAVPMGRMAYMTGWCAANYWNRYRVTLDREWLASTGYPALRDLGLFYLDFMQRGDDGLYHIFPSNQGEDGFTGDPKDYTDRPQVMRHARYCLRVAAAAAEVLGVDPELRAGWTERLEKCAGDDGKPPVKLDGVRRLFAETNPPEFADGRPYVAPNRGPEDALWPKPTEWLDEWYAGQYPIVAMGVLRGGEFGPERGYRGLRHIVERWRHPNGLVWAMALADYGHSGAWTETLGIVAPLQEMMLQSYGGVLRLFPGWPASHDASFATFRAEGAFLVSAGITHGVVGPVAVRSERGGPCRLYSPWPDGLRVTDAAGAEVRATGPADGIFEFATTAGGVYRVTAK
ncbi:MAG: hypothetical protein HZB16_10520 [Armatimonadetes bacterium]|nr:hypothetical protein [Armatimonadota bacterium]